MMFGSILHGNDMDMRSGGGKCWRQVGAQRV